MSESVSFGATLKYSTTSWGYSSELWVSGSTALSGFLELLAASLLLPTRLELCVFVSFYILFYIFFLLFVQPVQPTLLVIKIRSRQKRPVRKKSLYRGWRDVSLYS